jgi:nitrate/TMAO reductase-like tetraheme cytochrome c subunit
MMRFLSAPLIVALALFPIAAIAQTVTTSPHGKFDAACSQCHLSDAWRPVKISPDFKHAPNRFPLTGAHASATCASCHKNLEFTGVSTSCASCHRDAHHGSVGGGNSCARCHSSRNFLDMSVMRQAHQVSAFPLTGRHVSLDCRSCHVQNAPGQLSFASLSPSCVGCHLVDYQRAVPSHTASGFPTDCASCHSPRGWQAAAFDHSRTKFPLTGAHRTLSCQSCHSDNVYRGKPTTCVSCHQADYNTTTNPSHSAAQFPTDCASCHTTTAWAGAKFNHDASFFPIYSGAHAGKWSSCATCHTNPTNFAVFNCLSCHTQSQTDAQHRGRNGYVYASPNCYACHPRGNGG